MKIKNYIGAFALGCALVFPLTNLPAQASELTINTNENIIEKQNTDIKNLPNYDLASKREIESYKKIDVSDNKENIPNSSRFS